MIRAKKNVFLFTLHNADSNHRILKSTLTETPEEAAFVFRGKFEEIKGMPDKNSKDSDNHNLHGKVIMNNGKEYYLRRSPRPFELKPE